MKKPPVTQTISMIWIFRVSYYGIFFYNVLFIICNLPQQVDSFSPSCPHSNKRRQITIPHIGDRNGGKTKCYSFCYFQSYMKECSPSKLLPLYSRHERRKCNIISTKNTRMFTTNGSENGDIEIATGNDDLQNSETTRTSNKENKKEALAQVKKMELGELLSELNKRNIRYSPKSTRMELENLFVDNIIIHNKRERATSAETYKDSSDSYPSTTTKRKQNPKKFSQNNNKSRSRNISSSSTPRSSTRRDRRYKKRDSSYYDEDEDILLESADKVISKAKNTFLVASKLLKKNVDRAVEDLTSDFNDDYLYNGYDDFELDDFDYEYTGTYSRSTKLKPTNQEKSLREGSSANNSNNRYKEYDDSLYKEKMNSLPSDDTDEKYGFPSSKDLETNRPPKRQRPWSRNKSLVDDDNTVLENESQIKQSELKKDSIESSNENDETIKSSRRVNNNEKGLKKKKKKKKKKSKSRNNNIPNKNSYSSPSTKQRIKKIRKPQSKTTNIITGDDPDDFYYQLGDWIFQTADEAIEQTGKLVDYGVQSLTNEFDNVVNTDVISSMYYDDEQKVNLNDESNNSNKSRQRRNQRRRSEMMSPSKTPKKSKSFTISSVFDRKENPFKSGNSIMSKLFGENLGNNNFMLDTIQSLFRTIVVFFSLLTRWASLRGTIAQPIVVCGVLAAGLYPQTGWKFRFVAVGVTLLLFRTLAEAIHGYLFGGDLNDFVQENEHDKDIDDKRVNQ